MSQPAIDWAAFHRATIGRPRRELLARTLGCFELEGRTPGVAVDLGCGSGAETIEMLRRGWRVHAVDADAHGPETVRQAVPEATAAALTLHVARFEEFEFPECDLIWAGYSWPYCQPAAWKSLWRHMVAALRPDGRIAGDIFGNKHAWANEPEIQTFPESAVRELLSGLIVEAFDVEDGIRPSAGSLTRWHSFGIAARKPPSGP